MDIFGILDPVPHRNLCGSETLLTRPCEMQHIWFGKFLPSSMISHLYNWPIRQMGTESGRGGGGDGCVSQCVNVCDREIYERRGIRDLVSGISVSGGHYRSIS